MNDENGRPSYREPSRSPPFLHAVSFLDGDISPTITGRVRILCSIREELFSTFVPFLCSGRCSTNIAQWRPIFL